MEDKQTLFEIPVDSSIESFHNHLKTHNRTILSAKFGDGKSYFLQKFMADEEVNKDFVFLTLYPVNYQVEENRDVFDLIKYDLFIQLFVHKVMEPDFKLTKRQALEWCIQLNAPSLVEGLLPIFANLYLDEASAKMMAAFLTAKKSIGKIRQKVNDLMEPVRDKQIEQFIKEMSKNPVSGLDVISEIIKKGIADYKKEHQDKQLVLIIEDMDRMDPAHLFRILNVFSAHIDYNFRFGDDPQKPLIDNKFGLDKVVFVMCYENTKHIFHHFYGEKTDFEGYINKFCSSNYFNYSFSKEKERYLYNRMAINTGVDPITLKLFVRPDDLEKHSIREVVKAIEEVDGFVIAEVKLDYYSRVKNEINIGVLKVIAILRKLGMTDEEIKERLNQCMASQEGFHQVFSYMACLLLYAKRGNVLGRMSYRKQVGNEFSIVDVQRVDEHGKAVCQFYYERGPSNDVTGDILIVLDKLLAMVSS